MLKISLGILGEARKLAHSIRLEGPLIEENYQLNQNQKH
jgi:hypothetical protein